MEFSELYSHYDQVEEDDLKFKRQLEVKIDKHYKTFYEKLLERTTLGPITFSLVFGLVLFFLHLGASALEESTKHNSIAADFTFFLSILNGAGLYLVFSATEKLKDFIVNLFQLTKRENSKASKEFLLIYKNDFLSSRTIFFGLAFGCINTALAFVFGLKYLDDAQWFLLSTLCLQVFTVGFIGGITVNATLVIIKLINNISIKEDINLTYFYPDQCAGTLIIGNILFNFSLHFIAIGGLIFLFIHNMEWTRESADFTNYYVDALIVFWKTFSFILAGLIFFVPVKKINRILTEYKIFEQLKIRKRLNYLTQLIISFESDNQQSKEKIEILDSHYEKLSKIDNEISRLNTWPYNLKYRATFLSIFLPVIIGIILQISNQIFN